MDAPSTPATASKSVQHPSSFKTSIASLFKVRKDPSYRMRRGLVLLSFVIPILLWSMVSYVPFVWHSQMRVIDQGDTFFKKDQYVKRPMFYEQKAIMEDEGKRPPVGERSNPEYLPAPHEVVIAFYKLFTTPPDRKGEPWFHQSMGNSILIIAYGYGLAVLIGLPIGILCGTYNSFKWITEPFAEFARYLPPPAFSVLAVAVLGLYQAPKVFIVFLGTFFQLILIISKTVGRVDMSLIEAAQTLGSRTFSLIFRVIVPASLPYIYRDLRILLGWAWTWLVIAEVVGNITGLTWTIQQQARYRNFENVYAVIILIGIIGAGTDYLLGSIEKRFFPWQQEEHG